MKCAEFFQIQRLAFQAVNLVNCFYQKIDNIVAETL